jgi:hypothetical protein
MVKEVWRKKGIERLYFAITRLVLTICPPGRPQVLYGPVLREQQLVKCLLIDLYNYDAFTCIKYNKHVRRVNL